MRNARNFAKHLSAIRDLAAAVGADAEVRTGRSASFARGEPRLARGVRAPAEDARPPARPLPDHLRPTVLGAPLLVEMTVAARASAAAASSWPWADRGDRERR
jgi:hypothetical protein